MDASRSVAILRRVRGAVVALVLVLAFVPGAVRSADAGSACAGWAIFPAPNPEGSSNIVDVDTLPDGAAWAVGFGIPGFAFDTIAVRFDGTAWERVPTPNPGSGSNRLDNVDAVAADDVWAAGSQSDRSTTANLIEHWDGSTWSVIPSPNVPASFNDLQGIAMAGTDDGWAVGTAQSFDASSVVPVVQHWDGSTWSLVRRVPRAGDYTYLTDVAARSTDDVWAVGSAFRASGWHNLAMHWDGTAWTVFEVPSPGVEDNYLEAVVSRAADDAWAVGYAADSGVSSRRPVVVHWDGSEWSLVQSPDLSGQLNSVAAGPDGRLWAAGYREVPPLTLMERWDGSRWQVIRSENRPDSIDNALFGIAVGSDPTSAWAVGSTAVTQSTLQSLVEHPCDTA